MDHETKESYAVTVTARDPSDTTGNQSRDSITVNISVLDVNETPELTLPDANITGTFGGDLDSGFTHSEPVVFDDIEPGGTATVRLSITFVGDDPEILNMLDDKTELTWTLAGTDADDFDIDNGVLTFKSGPDFEAPTDSGRNNVYEVTVQAADEAGNTASVKVKITVENVGEKGTVTLSHTRPEIGTVRLTASLSDPDREKSPRWQWYRGGVAETASLPTDTCTDRQ